MNIWEMSEQWSPCFDCLYFINRFIKLMYFCSSSYFYVMPFPDTATVLYDCPPGVSLTSPKIALEFSAGV